MSRERSEQPRSTTRWPRVIAHLWQCPAIGSARLPAQRSERLFLAVLALALLLIVPGARRAAASFPCAGDCSDDGNVTVEELVTGVTIALGTAEVGACAPLDLNGDGAVTINELIKAVPPRVQPVTDEERADAVGSAIYHAWVKQIWDALPPPPPEAWGDDWQNWGLQWRFMSHLLRDIDQTDPAFRVYTMGPNGDSTLWDDPATAEVETRTEVLLGALSRALDLLEQKFPSADMSTWLWGKLHQVRFQHFIGQSGIPTFDIGPIPAPGGFFTANAAYPGVAADNFVFYGGPSQRLVVLLDPAGIKAVNILPGGQNGNPGDLTKYNQINPATHYGDLIPGWINGETFETRITRQDVAADSQRQVRYVPAEE